MSTVTVPLVENADGTWTSPSPAWAHLIMRESGGNPTIIQQIIDVNSGGNEAEGLFQITPATWRAHHGNQFAPTARLASPQQQAIVAARIFTANPSGSDWGAGLPGREDASELAAGLVDLDIPPPPRFFPEVAHRVFHDHLGEPYVYGGLDCSGLVDFELTALTTGTVDGWTRHVTTESWNPDAPIGGGGPFGSYRVPSPDVPGAVAVIAIHHGGGGPDSHMNVRIDGELMESNGDHGICTEGNGAIPQDSDYWTDWWAIRGAIPPTVEGFLMALSEQEQRELLDRIRQLSGLYDVNPSKSRYADARVWNTHDFVRNIDGHMFDLICEHNAALGDPWSLSAVQTAAARGDQIALNFLAGLSAAPPTAPPNPNPTPNPTPSPPPPSPPQPQPTTGTSFSGAIDQFTQQMQAANTAFAQQMQALKAALNSLIG